MRLLVAILTSSKPDLVKLCYESVRNQFRPFDFEYDIVVIVNSINSTHIEDVRAILPKYVTIHDTESNGKPGKGHNSALGYFQSKSEYDYCIIVDGDDFLYPRAFMRLQHYLHYRPDMLFIAFHDSLQPTLAQENRNVPFVSFHNKCYLSYNIDAVTIDEWYKIKGAIHPFQRDINHMNTIARPFVFSRKSLDYDIYYDENMQLYDDFNVFLKAFEQHALGNLRVFTMVESNMYLYNTTTQDTASKKYFSPENETAQVTENDHYKKSIRSKFLALRRWDLTKMPLLELGQNNEPDEFLVKCKFVRDLATKLNMPCIIPQEDNMDIVMKYCKESGNTVFYDDLVQTLEWLYQ